MNIVFFNSKHYDKTYFNLVNHDQHRLRFLDVPLDAKSAQLVDDEAVVCVFVNDQVNAEMLQVLQQRGVKLIALRCAGYNNVDLVAAKRLGLAVVNVPAYSPNAVAEHAVSLILSLNRKLHQSHARVRNGNFAHKGLLGFDLHGRTAGIIGTGKIGRITGQILLGFGMRVLAHDPQACPTCEQRGMQYVNITELYNQSDIISLHCPLTKQTQHLIDAAAIAQMKSGVMLINTSRGAVIDTAAVIEAVKTKKIGYLGLDVYENESELFFNDLSENIIQDDQFARLLAFPNVLISPHQAYLTAEALTNIAQTTLQNASAFAQQQPLSHQL